MTDTQTLHHNIYIIINNRSSLTEHNDWFDGEEEETDAEPRETEYEDDMTVIKDH